MRPHGGASGPREDKEMKYTVIESPLAPDAGAGQCTYSLRVEEDGDSFIVNDVSADGSFVQNMANLFTVMQPPNDRILDIIEALLP